MRNYYSIEVEPEDKNNIIRILRHSNADVVDVSACYNLIYIGITYDGDVEDINKKLDKYYGI